MSDKPLFGGMTVDASEPIKTIWGGPAFPVPSVTAPNGELIHGTLGMTLRDYFAAKAMQGDWAALNAGQGESIEDCAKRYYKMADAMLKAREQ